MRYILLWIWQLPQNLVGFVISRFCTKAKFIAMGESYYVYSCKMFFHSAASLGNYIIYDSRSRILYRTVLHEHGHQKQSLYFGWFYFLVIGLPSLCGNIWDRLLHKNWTSAERFKWYYAQPWEAWADKLGGVTEVSL